MNYLYLFFIPPLLSYLIIGFNPIRLFRNYLLARRTNFPILLTPCHPGHIPWTILGPMVRQTLRRILPPTIYTRFNMTTYGFEFHEKNAAHARIGKSFMLVTSGPIELKVADPDLAMEFLRRPKEFRQTLIGSAVMRIFGDNLITSDGEHWARQRKLIASNINEKISDTVFKESRRQAREMMEVYGSENGGVTDNYAEGLKGIAINVLGVAGYGMSRTWKESLEKQEPLPGFQLTYIEATRLAVDHIVEASIFPAWLFLLRFMPKKVQELGYAVKEFPAHTQNMLDQERKKPSEKVNIMNMLVKESDAVQGGDVEKEGEKGRAGLTEDEIMGNLFVFTAAGFDTTANTMGYAMTELAAHPQWQGWMAEEIDEVLAGKAEELEYNEVFPRLVRVLAVMYETMRIFPPVVHVAKETSPDLTQPVVVTHPISGTVHHLPASITVYINCVAVQNDPIIYGDDVELFRPDRFLDDSSEKGKPTIKNYGKGTFLAWSGGPRVCPGSKMSQVEFVSVFMSIFSKYRVELVLREVSDGKGGKRQETMAEGRARVEELMADSQSRLTLQMNRPREVELRFVERGRS